MILSASRRTDIPAFYSEWFLRRIQEQYSLVRNPMNFRQISRINLSPDVIDCIVFWTKNPAPMMDKLSQLREYPFYFQYTLNPYDVDLEQNLPSLDQRIATFHALSAQLGKNRVIWRYDPVILNHKYNIDYHKEQFHRLAEQLHGSTYKCTISFVDMYRKIQKKMKQLDINEVSKEEQAIVCSAFSAISKEYGLSIDSCVAGDVDLRHYGIKQASCIDPEYITDLLGCPLDVKKDKTQRPGCQCMMSVDIGSYNTCLHGCQYCYATHSQATTEKNTSNYDVLSPLLCGNLSPDDTIHLREIKTVKRV